MAAVLGVSGTYHDAAAALVVDGALVVAIQEERLSRVKNDPSLPRQAIAACLAHAGLDAAALDRVVFYEDPYAKLERVLTSTLGNFPRSLRQFPRAMATQLGAKVWVIDQLADLLGLPRARIGHVAHHHAHAASAFFASPYPEAAVITVDGVGEAVSTALWHGRERALACLGELHYPHSLGLLYAAFTAYLGFEVNEGEYKVMGLAAYGAPRFEAELRKVIRLADDGSFELTLAYFGHLADPELGFGPALERLLGPRRRPYTPWDLAGSAADRRYADIAASLQRVTEDALLGLARAARARTGCDALCLAGGVALNAVANARLAREAGFARVFVQPAAGDAGGALGAAILGALELGDPRPAALTAAALGLPIATGDAVDLARALGLTATTLAEPAAEVAARLDDGAILATCHGRFEWGPRALGQRSLLASPRDPEIRERLNRAVKRREPFRPFAPAVLATAVADHFDAVADELTPFMTTVAPVRADARDLAAVTHVDGTARLQTVTATSASALHDVLVALAARGRPPIVLNTSLNGAGEPIVARAADALGFLLAHPIDGLVVADVLITRGPA
ncbi:MAG: carbamoyl transferase [Myxococcales bacterium]|nr:carbamoyl transferase [Myxococcales bacterium]